MIYFNYQLPIIVYFQRQHTNCYYITSDNVFSDWLTSLVYGCATVVVFCFVIVLCLVPKIVCVSALSIIICPPPFVLPLVFSNVYYQCEEHTDVRLLWFFVLSSFSVLFPRLSVSLYCWFLITLHPLPPFDIL